jgi:dTDP-4-amino-4,6-dideoxygalactose transaminase
MAADGAFTKKCNSFLEKELGVQKALLTTCGAHALEMSAILLDIQHGDEVIFPDCTFNRNR